MTQSHTRYSNLTLDELLNICDNHYANDLIVELRQRLEETADKLQQLNEQLQGGCAHCEDETN